MYVVKIRDILLKIRRYCWINSHHFFAIVYLLSKLWIRGKLLWLPQFFFENNLVLLKIKVSLKISQYVLAVMIWCSTVTTYVFLFKGLGSTYLKLFSQGSFTNYVDKFLAFFDHIPPSVYIFYLMNVDKNQHFLTTYPLLL